MYRIGTLCVIISHDFILKEKRSYGMFNVKNGLNIFSAIVFLMILSSCSNDPYSGFVGIWKHETSMKVNVVKISNDGDDYFMTTDLLSKNSQNVSKLVKEQGMLILNPKTFQAALVELTDSDDVIKIKKNKYYKISGAELSELEDLAAGDSSKLKGNKLRQSLSEYYLDTDEFPEKLQDLVSDTGSSSWMGPYVKENEILDSWGNEYIYEKSGNSVQLISFGKDNREGGDGINQDEDFSFSIDW